MIEEKKISLDRIVLLLLIKINGLKRILNFDSDVVKALKEYQSLPLSFLESSFFGVSLEESVFLN